MEIKAIANLARFKDIVVTLLTYGFDDLVERLDLPGARLVGRIRKTDHGLGSWERIRLALEDLGPTFIKFGQIMSLRPDLLPKPLIQELRKLQDEVAPEEFTHIRNVLEKSLERSLEDVFSVLEEQSLAGASLSQVHRAVLKGSGAVVAVKVQRPKIRSKIETDLDILAVIAERVQRRFEEARLYDLPSLVRITRRTLLRELDFRREARHMKIARAHLTDTPGVYVPEAYMDYCTEHVLVMEFIQGIKLKDLGPEGLDDSELLAKQGLNAIIKQILEDGFFHADPHPGNILIRDGKVLCLLDWGMIGRLTEEERHELVDLIHAVVDKDSRRLVDALLMIGALKGEINRRGLERDLLDIIDSHAAIPIRELHLGQLLFDITALLREYQLRIPSDLAIMIKALITAEGVAREIYPELDVISEADAYVKRLTAQRFTPGSIWEGVRDNFFRLLVINRRLFNRTVQIVDKVERGDLAIRLEHENLGGLRKTLENVSNRVTFGIIIAAMIIGSSMIITTGVKPLLFGFPAIGVIGYLISGVLGLWLVFNIIRTRRY